MSSKGKIMATAAVVALLGSTIQLPTLAEANDTNNCQGKKLEVNTAPMGDLERKYFELKTQVDRLLEPSNRFGFPWAIEPFGWHSMLGDVDSMSKKIEQLAGNAFWPNAHWGSYLPRMETIESDKELKITAEVPGIDENHLDVSVRGDTVTIKGQKEVLATTDTKAKRAAERRYGTFERTLKLPYQVDSEKAEASLKNGVLTVVVPKLPGQPTEGRKLAIRKE